MSHIEICRRPDQQQSGEAMAAAASLKPTTQSETIQTLQSEVETLRAQLAEEVERADARAITDPCELFLLSTFREARQKDRFALLKAAIKANQRIEE